MDTIPNCMFAELLKYVSFVEIVALILTCRTMHIKVYICMKKYKLNRYFSIYNKRMSTEDYVKICQMGHSGVIYKVHYPPYPFIHELKDACKWGYIEIVHVYLGRGARDYNEGLSEACYYGHMKIVNCMINAGADAWEWGFSGACAGGHWVIAVMMLQKGARNFKKGMMEAAYKQQFHILKLFHTYYQGRIQNGKWLDIMYTLCKDNHSGATDVIQQFKPELRCNCCKNHY